MAERTAEAPRHAPGGPSRRHAPRPGTGGRADRVAVQALAPSAAGVPAQGRQEALEGVGGDPDVGWGGGVTKNHSRERSWVVGDQGHFSGNLLDDLLEDIENVQRLLVGE